MTHTRNITGIRAAAALLLGLSLVTFPAFGDPYELAAGASDTLTSETAETTTYDSMSIAGSLTVSGKKTVESTGGISVPGGTVTVSGANARLGYGHSTGTDWTLGFDALSDEYGKVVIDGGKTDYAVGAKTFTVANGGNGVGGYIDFMEINGGGFKPYTLRNKSDLTARIKVSGTSWLTKPAKTSNGMGIIAEGPFEILLADAAQLTIDFGNQRGSLNGGSSSENSVDIVGVGDVAFKMYLYGNYPCRLRTGAKLNPVGSVTFGCQGNNAAKFSLEGDNIFGANVTNVCVAAAGGNVTLDIAAGTTQTVRRLSFLRAGKDDVITGAGTLRLNAVDVGAVFAARIADDAALTIEKTGAQPVTAPRIASYPALKILAGSYMITNDCFVSDLSGASGATLVADGCTVTIAGGNYALGGLELATANGGSFVKTGAGTARLYAPGSLGATLHVAEGDAVFSAIGLPQRYWRFTFTGMSGGTPAAVRLRGIYLFGTTGAWENSGLGASSRYVTEVDTPELAANTARYFVNSATNVVADSSETYYNISRLYNLFSTANGANNRPVLLSPEVDSGNPDSYLSIEFRLNDGGNPITGYNLCNGTGTGGGAYPSAWSVFASDDGESWTEIDSRSGETCETESGKYYTYDGGAEYGAKINGIKGKTVAELPGVVTEHFKFSGYKGDGLEADASKAIAIQVDNGASLDLTAFTVAPQKIGGITIDLAKGGGTIRGGSIAAAGVLEIVDAGGTLNYGQPLPLVFDGVTGTENFANWTVTVNGVAVKRELVFRDGALAFNNPGLVIIVK